MSFFKDAFKGSIEKAFTWGGRALGTTIGGPTGGEIGARIGGGFGKKVAGTEVFEVDPNVFMKARFGKKKYARYEHYVGNDEIGEEIRQYGRANPDKSIILQDSLTGAMLYLKYGKNHARI